MRAWPEKVKGLTAYWRAVVRAGSPGQELIEYALVAGFIAVLIGAMVPGQIVPSLSVIYSKLLSVMVVFHG